MRRAVAVRSSELTYLPPESIPAVAAGLIRLAGFARLDPQVQRRSGRSHLLLRCLFLPTITAPTNGNCFGFFCVPNSTREPQSGWAEPMEMWAEGSHHCGFGSGDERRKQGHVCPRWNPRWMQNVAALWANVQEQQMSRGCRRNWECSSSLLELRHLSPRCSQAHLKGLNLSLVPILPSVLLLLPSLCCLFSDSRQQAHCRYGDCSHAHSALLFQHQAAQSETRGRISRRYICQLSAHVIPSVFALYFHTIQSSCSFHQSIYWLL